MKSKQKASIKMRNIRNTLGMKFSYFHDHRYQGCQRVEAAFSKG